MIDGEAKMLLSISMWQRSICLAQSRARKTKQLGPYGVFRHSIHRYCLLSLRRMYWSMVGLHEIN
jgi:hypothetical protein